MKVYESAYTYLPLVYLLVASTSFGWLYHQPSIAKEQPFVILTFFLLNTTAFFYHRTRTLIRNIVHKHMWKTATLAFYGILVQSIHERMFHEYHNEDTAFNYFISFIYLVAVVYMSYIRQSDSGTVYTHIAFLYFPIRKMWQINLYLYAIFVCASTIIIYSKVPRSALLDHAIQRKPVLRYFLYLRLDDAFVLLGALQLLFDYHNTLTLELQDVYAIQAMVDRERRNLKEREDMEVGTRAPTPLTT